MVARIVTYCKVVGSEVCLPWRFCSPKKYAVMHDWFLPFYYPYFS